MIGLITSLKAALHTWSVASNWKLNSSDCRRGAGIPNNPEIPGIKKRPSDLLQRHGAGFNELCEDTELQLTGLEERGSVTLLICLLAE